MVGTQSYTLRLSSQNRLSLSRDGFFHGFALGLWKENKETFRLRHENPDGEGKGMGGGLMMMHA